MDGKRYIAERVTPTVQGWALAGVPSAFVMLMWLTRRERPRRPVGQVVIMAGEPRGENRTVGVGAGSPPRPGVWGNLNAGQGCVVPHRRARGWWWFAHRRRIPR